MTFARGTLGVVVGLVVSAPLSAGLVTTPPATPATKTTTSPVALGGQLSVTSPLQLPAEPAGAAPLFREADITLKDTTNAGLSLAQQVTISAVGVSPADFVVERFDDKTRQWSRLPAEYSTALFNVNEQVAVPAGGKKVERYRFSAAMPGGSVDILASGAGAVHVILPITAPALSLSQSPPTVPAGVPVLLGDALTNKTDVDYSHLDVQVSVKTAPASACLNVKSLKLEIQSGGSWKPVALTSQQPCGEAVGTALPNAALPHGGVLQIPLRVTVNGTNPPATSFVFTVTPVGLRYSGTGLVQVVNLMGAAATPSATEQTGQTATASVASPAATTSAPSPSAVAAPAKGDRGSSATGVFAAIGAAAVSLIAVAAFFVVRRR
jgi:hypothetical protein